MAYLSFDLDGKKQAARAAKAAGVEPGLIAWGLLELWEYAWQTKTASVGQMALDACFGPSERVRDALVVFGFVEKDGDTWRVKGAERYLRISEAKSSAGKSRAAKAKRNATGQLLPSTKPARAGKPSSGQPALTPSTEHPTPNTLETTAGAEAPRVKAPRLALSDSLSADFLELRKEAYAFQGAKDGQALTRLMNKGTPEEIRQRWRKGLLASGWGRVSTFAQLDAKWNDLAGTGPPKDLSRGMVRAQDVDQTEFATMGEGKYAGGL